MDSVGLSMADSTGGLSTLLNLLILTISSICPPDLWPGEWNKKSLNYLDKYDFIVVGAGSAGCALANRLSENPNRTVLLLEAGGNPPLEAEIPGLLNTLCHTSCDWNYYAERSNKASKAYPGGCYWPRGKCLGGTSSINDMIYLKGTKFDFDKFEEYGIPGWEYSKMNEFYNKIENNQAEGLAVNPDGFIKVDYFHSNEQERSLFVKALEELNYNTTTDFNGQPVKGFGVVRGMVYNGTRQSAAKAFLHPIKDRDNLHVIKHAHCTKVVFNSENERIVGVQFVHNGEEYLVKSKKEVILSAGAVNTPQILMLSGIGPTKHLKKCRVEVKRNLPVGYNLQDHCSVPLFIKFNNVQSETTMEERMDALYTYIRSCNGPLANIGVSDFVGFINANDETVTRPNIMYNHKLYLKNHADIETCMNGSGAHPHLVKQVCDTNKHMAIAIVTVTVLNPKSTGEIRLRSNNPLESPKIMPNYFGDEHLHDLNTTVSGIKCYEKILDTDAFKSAGAEFIRFNLPECDVNVYRSALYWSAYCRYFSTSMSHACGTAKMGAETDPMSVTDYKMKVRSVRGLRVADASVLPECISGTSSPTSAMLGFRCAEIIKEQWQTYDEYNIN